MTANRSIASEGTLSLPSATASFGSEDLILVRNSWGPAWGADGHAWVRETYLSRRLFGGFSISEGDGDVLQSDAGGIDARARVG